MQAPNYPLNSEGVWCEVLTRPRPGRPALFWTATARSSKTPNIFAAPKNIHHAAVIAAANRLGIAVVLVTNQAGIGRGYYGWAEFKTVQQAIAASLADDGAQFDAVYACAHHPQGRDGFAHPDHPARKPNPGMLLRAASDLAIDLKASWLVGDKATDVEFRQNAPASPARCRRQLVTA